MIHWLLALCCWASPEPASPAPDQPPEAASPERTEDPIRSPEQVEAEAGSGAVRTPEQVQAEAGPKPTGAGAPSSGPSARAHPSEGVYAVGSGPLAPLPPAPPPVPLSTIEKFEWRGVGWLALRVSVTGPIGGAIPARPTVVALGGGVEGGWRANQIVALGFGVSRQPHEVFQSTIDDQTIVRRGSMSVWDIAFVRGYAPVRGRVEPFVDLGGGMAFLEPALEGAPLEVGGTVRASLGFDAWLTRNLTLGVSGVYRATILDDLVGHSIQGIVELAVHW